MNARERISTWTPGIEPITKGGEQGLIRGICTSERRDMQGEILRVDGADFSPFLGSLAKGEMTAADSGAVTMEHPAGVFNPVGEPVDLERGETRDGVPCYYLTTRLWINDEPVAKQLWEKILRINRASNRVRLGYSVEGAAQERDKNDRRDVKRWYCANVVITGAPRNRDAWFDPILASLRATPEGRAMLRKAMNESEVLDDGLSALLPDAAHYATANGVEVDPLQRLTALAVRLNLNELDLAVAAALKGSAAWKQCLSQIMTRVVAG